MKAAAFIFLLMLLGAVMPVRADHDDCFGRSGNWCSSGLHMMDGQPSWTVFHDTRFDDGTLLRLSMQSSDGQAVLSVEVTEKSGVMVTDVVLSVRSSQRNQPDVDNFAGVPVFTLEGQRRFLMERSALEALRSARPGDELFVFLEQAVVDTREHMARHVARISLSGLDAALRHARGLR